MSAVVQKIIGDLSPSKPWVSWEENAVAFYDENYFLLACIAASYLPMIFGLQRYMANREAFRLKVPLVLWNLALAAFSIMGAYNTVPHLLAQIRQTGVQGEICRRGCYASPVSWWIFVFNLSKIPEFVDTIFLRLRKKPVILLHWYHHIATMLFCWYANQVGDIYNCTGFFFATMNLSVHSVMYLYYAVAAMGYARAMAKMNLNIVLTSIQIIQMFGGIYFIYLGTKCEKIDFNGTVYSIVMYTSYAILFSLLFINKYCTSEDSKVKAKQK